MVVVPEREEDRGGEPGWELVEGKREQEQSGVGSGLERGRWRGAQRDVSGAEGNPVLEAGLLRWRPRPPGTVSLQELGVSTWRRWQRLWGWASRDRKSVV